MNKEWKPLLETKNVNIYQKDDKTLIINRKEITLQTNKKIIKIKKLEKPPHERYLP